jgi:hypothetical protein
LSNAPIAEDSMQAGAGPVRKDKKAKKEAKGWRCPEHRRNHQQVPEHHLQVPVPEAAIIMENTGDEIIRNKPTEAPTAPETILVVGNVIMIDN